MTAAVLTGADRPQRRFPGAMPLQAVLGFWMAVGLLAAVADFSDPGAPPDVRFSQKLQLYGAVFMPFALYSAALALAFARYPVLLRARNLALLCLGTLLVFLPVYGLYETAAVLTLAGKPLPGLADMLVQPTAWNRWLDTMMASMALSVHAAWAYWQQGQQQARAVREADRANVALRLSLLQGQLEPTFLLSALDGIADLVLHAERSQATRALARLADLLRHALRASQQDWISVADEIAFVRDYVELQVLRFGDRVEVEWERGEANWQLPVCPPLLLHALLDHAIARCLETTAAAGPVRVSLTLAAARVLIIVSHPHGAGPVDPGLALADTRTRLALLYQGAATLTYSVDGERVYGALEIPSREGCDD